MKRMMLGMVVVLGAVVALRADEAPGKFVALFDGKTLDGWMSFPEGTGNWKVEDGAIVGTGKASHLFTKRGDFGNFHLRAEVQINEGGNSGMYFRTKFGPGFPQGYEAQINSTHRDPVKSGSLYRFRNDLDKETLEKLSIKDMLVKPGEWFTYEVIAKGNVITIKVNGKETIKEFKDEKNTYTKGHFAFQQHHEGSEVKVRKVEVMELGDK